MEPCLLCLGIRSKWDCSLRVKLGFLFPSHLARNSKTGILAIFCMNVGEHIFIRPSFLGPVSGLIRFEKEHLPKQNNVNAEKRTIKTEKSRGKILGFKKF